MTAVVNLRILMVNDVYSPLQTRGQGGWAELSTMIKEFRCDNTLFVLPGDFLGGSTLAQLHEGKYCIDIMNHMGVDYVVIGNHEFDFGDSPLKDRMRESNFQWFGANVKERDTGALFGEALATKTIDISAPGCDNTGDESSVRIGIFGITTQGTPKV